MDREQIRIFRIFHVFALGSRNSKMRKIPTDRLMLTGIRRNGMELVLPRAVSQSGARASASKPQTMDSVSHSAGVTGGLYPSRLGAELYPIRKGLGFHDVVGTTGQSVQFRVRAPPDQKLTSKRNWLSIRHFTCPSLLSLLLVAVPPSSPSLRH